MKIIFAPMICAQLAESARRHEPWLLEHSIAESIEPALDEVARQAIIQDPYQFAEWDQSQTIRCFVHPCGPSVWRQITGAKLPHLPLTAQDYEEAGIPWCNAYRDDGKALPENPSITPDRVSQHDTRRPGEIREFLDRP